MAIARPVTKTIIATQGWGVPITDEVNRLSGIITPPTAWQNLSIATGFGALSGFQVPGVRLNGTVIEFRGCFVTTSSLSANVEIYLATIPTGFRPSIRVILNAAGGAGSATALRMDVYATGRVTIWFPTGVTAGFYISIDGLTIAQ